MKKKKSQNTNNKKQKKEQRFRSVMYAESIGCLPKKWLDHRYMMSYNDDVVELEDVYHKDGTPVTYHPNAILDMNALEKDLNEIFDSEHVKWAAIVHDKEYLTDTKIKPHIHIAIYFEKSPKTISAVRKLLGLYDETKEPFIQAFKGTYAKQSMFSYLPHLTEEASDEKESYEDYLNLHSKFRANFDCKKLIRIALESVKSKAYDMSTVVDDILNRDVIEYDIYCKNSDTSFTKFYIDNKRKIDTAINASNKQVIAQGKRGLSSLYILYIQGEPGSGKTQLAKHIAEKNFKHYYISGAGNDPAQDYMGQECFIFDDARPIDFQASDWLKMLDPYNTVPAMKSRYFNKPMPVKCIILTTTTPFEDFFVYAKNKGKVVDEPLAQFIRRFTGVIDVSKDVGKHLDCRLQRLKTYTSDGHSSNFRLSRNNGSRDCIPFEGDNKHYSTRRAIELFREKYNIDALEKEYDSYTVGRVYSVEQILTGESRTEVSIDLKDNNGSTTKHDFKIDRRLKERDDFIVLGLKNEKNDTKLDEILNIL